MLKKHPYLLALFIGALALLNLWKWLPTMGSSGPTHRSLAHGDLALDFPDPPGGGEETVHRNLFEPGPLPSTKPAFHKHKATTAAQVQPTPVPTPNSTAPDGSVSEVAGGYRLLGIASREGQSKALIGKGDQLFQVGQGEDIEGKYGVETITQSEVYLTEKQSGNTLKLRIWDQPEGPH